MLLEILICELFFLIVEKNFFLMWTLQNSLPRVALTEPG